MRGLALVVLVACGGCGFLEMKRPPLVDGRAKKLYADAWAAESKWRGMDPLTSQGARRACAWLMRDRALFDEVAQSASSYAGMHPGDSSGRIIDVAMFLTGCATLRDRELTGVAPRRHGRGGLTLSPMAGYVIGAYYDRGGIMQVVSTGHGPGGGAELWYGPYNMVAFGLRVDAARLSFDATDATFVSGEASLRGWATGASGLGGVYLTGGIGVGKLAGGDAIKDGMGALGLSYSGGLGVELVPVGSSSIVAFDLTLHQTQLGGEDIGEQIVMTLRWDVR